LMIASIFFIDFSSLSAKARSSAGPKHNLCHRRPATAEIKSALAGPDLLSDAA
jgi:hypothetical protein